MYTILERLYFNFQFNNLTLSYGIVLTIFQKLLLHSAYIFFEKNQFHGNGYFLDR